MNRLVQTFTELVKIDSESKEEGNFHQVLKRKLNSLGVDFFEDDTLSKTKLGGNNIVATLKGRSEIDPIFFSAHTDTVAPGKNIEVFENNGFLYSKGETILAADNKAGIAIILEAIQRIQERDIETGNLEFVFSPGEEIGLIGSAIFDVDNLQANVGYVLDSAKEVGRVTVASPHLYMYEVTITGKAAHAGIEPEKGLSALLVLTRALETIKIGRIDEQTTANIGKIKGGQATNVVMDHLQLSGEVRAISEDRALELLTTMQNSFNEAAQFFDATVSIKIKKMANGFNVTPETDVMQLLKCALDRMELSLIPEISGGGSDANSFNHKGKETVNLSIGYDKIHTTDEYISINEMEKAVELVITLATEQLKRSETR